VPLTCYHPPVLVSEIGEFALIRLLAQEIGVEYPPRPGAPGQRGMLVGLGDDAVVTPQRTGALIWTTDTMVSDVHFFAVRTPWPEVGWKSLASNVSDVAAMGGEPYLALVTLALPADFLVEDAQALYRGLYEAAQAFGVTLGGGDIVRSPVFSITVALSGWAYAERLGTPRAMTRGAARKGDIVAVSGAIGDSAGGLQLLKEESLFADDASQRLRAAHEHPQPRVALGRAAVRMGVRCAIDVSDGLLQDLGHVSRASGVRMRIDASRIPISPSLQETFPARAMGMALRGGEDYELLLVGRRAAIEALIDSSSTPLTAIGEVVADDETYVAVVDEMGREIPMSPQGWDHFAKS
jgi:thiamine-monophosphate kinase